MNVNQKKKARRKKRKAQKLRAISKKTSAKTGKLFKSAIGHHQAGQLEQAEDLYGKILKNAPNHSDAAHMLGILACQRGNPHVGADLIGKAISINPHVPAYHSNMGNVLCVLGQPEEAATCCRRAIELKPDLAEAHSNLGNALRGLGRPDEALICYKQAIELNPNLAEANSNTGAVFNELGKPEKALQFCRRAVALNPGLAEAHSNLGNALLGLDKPKEALLSCRRAVELNPDLAEAHNNLGAAFSTLGNGPEAIACYRRAIRLAPTENSYWQSFAHCMGTFNFPQADNSFAEDLERCFAIDGVEKQWLTKVAANQLKQASDIQALLRILQENSWLDLSRQIMNGHIFKALKRPLLILLMQTTVVTDPVIEKLLTEIRRMVLNISVSGELTACVYDDGLEFVCVLANQCFLNEYVFFQTEQEQGWIEVLQQQIEQTLDASDTISKFSVALLATYLPLYQLPFATKLIEFADSNTNTLFKQLIVRQIQEPVEEISIRKEIHSITEIKDGVSKAVRLQYEENPYPRWMNTPYQKPVPLAVKLRRLFPHLAGKAVLIPHPFDILIAGCGTGKHAIVCTQSYSGARILALDLSLASLAYGSRKARELEVSPVEFVQGDILELVELGRRFDVIECVGVLHHLHYPVEGMRILTNLLKKDGFMKIGLYSEIARQHVVAARTFISERGYEATNDGIRRCRQDLYAMTDDSKIKGVTLWNDFYTTSECRDLLFHVQEHRFTLPQISSILDELDLELVGFELLNPSVKKKYKDRFPDDSSATDLELWHCYELEHPNTFANMYQFWVTKR